MFSIAVGKNGEHHSEAGSAKIRCGSMIRSHGSGTGTGTGTGTGAGAGAGEGVGSERRGALSIGGLYENGGRGVRRPHRPPSTMPPGLRAPGPPGPRAPGPPGPRAPGTRLPAATSNSWPLAPGSRNLVCITDSAVSAVEPAWGVVESRLTDTQCRVEPTDHRRRVHESSPTGPWYIADGARESSLWARRDLAGGRESGTGAVGGDPLWNVDRRPVPSVLGVRSGQVASYCRRRAVSTAGATAKEAPARHSTPPTAASGGAPLPAAVRRAPG